MRSILKRGGGGGVLVPRESGVDVLPHSTTAAQKG